MQQNLVPNGEFIAWSEIRKEEKAIISTALFCLGKPEKQDQFKKKIFCMPIHILQSICQYLTTWMWL
jgi:hypothetical protein